MSSTLGIGLLMRRNFRSHRQDSRFSVFDGLGVTIAEAWPCACRLALCGRVTLLCSRPVFAAHKKHCCTRSRDKTSQPQQVHRSSTSRLTGPATSSARSPNVAGDARQILHLERPPSQFPAKRISIRRSLSPPRQARVCHMHPGLCFAKRYEEPANTAGVRSTPSSVQGGSESSA